MTGKQKQSTGPVMVPLTILDAIAINSLDFNCIEMDSEMTGDSIK